MGPPCFNTWTITVVYYHRSHPRKVPRALCAARGVHSGRGPRLQGEPGPCAAAEAVFRMKGTLQLFWIRILILILILIHALILVSISIVLHVLVLVIILIIFLTLVLTLIHVIVLVVVCVHVLILILVLITCSGSGISVVAPKRSLAVGSLALAC